MVIDTSQAYNLVLMALCVWREARGENPMAKLGVAWTVWNRAQKGGWWGNSPSSVVLKPYQFSSFNKNDPNAVLFPSETDLSWQGSFAAAQSVMTSSSTDPTNGATHYYDNSIDAPKWTIGATKTVTLGKLFFYKDVK